MLVYVINIAFDYILKIAIDRNYITMKK